MGRQEDIRRGLVKSGRRDDMSVGPLDPLLPRTTASDQTPLVCHQCLDSVYSPGFRAQSKHVRPDLRQDACLDERYRHVCDSRPCARRGGRSWHERLKRAPTNDCHARPLPLRRGAQGPIIAPLACSPHCLPGRGARTGYTTPPCDPVVYTFFPQPALAVQWRTRRQPRGCDRRPCLKRLRSSHRHLRCRTSPVHSSPMPANCKLGTTNGVMKISFKQDFPLGIASYGSDVDACASPPPSRVRTTAYNLRPHTCVVAANSTNIG